MTTDTASTRSSAKDHLDRSVTGDVDSQEIASRVERRNSRMPGTGNLQARSAADGRSADIVGGRHIRCLSCEQ